MQMCKSKNDRGLYPLASIKFILAMSSYQMAQRSSAQAVEVRATELFWEYCKFMWALTTPVNKLVIVCPVYVLFGYINVISAI